MDFWIYHPKGSLYRLMKKEDQVEYSITYP